MRVVPVLTATSADLDGEARAFRTTLATGVGGLYDSP